MVRYEGITRDDKPYKGGRYVTTQRRGGEVCNFFPVRGRLYGYVKPTTWSLNLERLGAAPGSDRLEGVDIVFTATKPKVGEVVIGWYRNATVLRDPKEHPPQFRELQPRHAHWYFATTWEKDACLLPVDDRVFPARREMNFLGQSNAWYPKKEIAEVRRWVDDLRSYMRTGKLPAAQRRVLREQEREVPARRGRAAGWPRNMDPEQRKTVEDAAINAVKRWLKEKDFRYESVEAQKCGWDLTATRGRELLHIEVKGLSGENLGVEMTPNEYEYFSRKHAHYRLAVVTSALARQPHIEVFAWHQLAKAWCAENDPDRRLLVQKLTGARIRI